MTQIDPAEAEALAADTTSPTDRREVAARDFSEPKSLSSEQLHLAHGLITSSLQSVGALLAAPLRSFHRLHLASVREVNVEKLFDGYVSPFLVHQFEVDGDLAWAVWDSAAASHAVEAVISGTGLSDEEPQARLLSRGEVGVLSRLMDNVTSTVCSGLGLETKSGTIAQDLDELLTLDSAGPGADARRLQVHLMLEGALGESEIVLYLPGVSASPLPDKEATSALPDHLDDVKLDVRAYLGAVDLPLSAMLAIEIGDVLPLNVEIGTPLEIYVEERACATGTWGQVRGTLAVRLDQLDLHPGDIDCPPNE